MRGPRDSEMIEHIAYQLWEQEGRPEGRAPEHWKEAQRMLEIEFRIGFPDCTGPESLDGEETRQAH